MNWGWNPGNSFKWSRRLDESSTIESSEAEGNFLDRCFASSLCLTLGCHGLRWGCTADFWGFAWVLVSKGACWIIWGSLNWLSEFLTKWWSYPFFSYRSFFFKIPTMLGLGALGTLTLWRKSLRFSIQNNKSCIGKKCAFWFFLRPERTFSKKVGGMFFHGATFVTFNLPTFPETTLENWMLCKKPPCLDENVSFFKLSLS